MSRDPFDGWNTQPASLHPYQYAYNNPVTLTDPNGQNPLACFVPAVIDGPIPAGDVITAGCLAVYGISALIVTLSTPQGQEAAEDAAEGLQDLACDVEYVLMPEGDNAGPDGQPPKGPGIGTKTIAITSLIAMTISQLVPILPPADQTSKRQTDEYVTVFHYISYYNALSIATSGVYHAKTKGNDGYGMYVTNYDHSSGYQGYKLSEDELKFGIKAIPGWTKQQVNGYVKLWIPKSKLMIGSQPYFYPMSKTGGTHPNNYPNISESEWIKYNNIRKELQFLVLKTDPGKGSIPGDIDIRQYYAGHGYTQFR